MASVPTEKGTAMARYKITCCHNCEKRFPGCRGSCDEYKTQRAELDATRAETKLAHDTAFNLNCFYYDSVHKRTKRVNYRNKYRRSR